MSLRAIHRAVLLLVLGALVLTPIGVGASPAVPAWRADTPWATETAIVEFGHDTISAEIADTPELRERGLGYRDVLQPGTGMLFVYDIPAARSFWMKGMRFCLDIVWIELNRIQGAAESVCPEPGTDDADLHRYVSPVPVAYVLELPAGWLDTNDYDSGDAVELVLPSSSP